MKRILFGLFFIVAINPSHAEVYKCVDAKGALVFAQKPCGSDAETIQVKNTTAGISITGDGDFSKVDADIRSRDISRAIYRHQDNIADLQKTRNAKLTELRRKQSTANNNLAGATYLQSLTAEMQSVTNDYNARIAMEQAAIRSLNELR